MLTEIARKNAQYRRNKSVPYDVLPVDADDDDEPHPLEIPIHPSRKMKPPIVKEEPNKIKDSMLWNYLCRWIENSKFLGALFRATFDYKKEQKIQDFNKAPALDFDIQIGTLIGNGCGILLALVFHFTFKFLKLYAPTISLNPPYRIFKTLASLGQPAGLLLANTLPFLPKGSQKIFAIIFSDIFAIAFGLCTIPYWIIRGDRDAVDAKQPKNKNRLAMIGREGWSKYAKTAIVLGVSLGQAVGAIVSFATGASMVSCLAIGGGISAITCFASVLIVVPLINKYFNNMLISEEDDKDSIRNNYIRSGITLGLALGATIGFFAFPGLGTVVSMMVGGAFASSVFGIAMGKYGYKISEYTKKHWKLDKNTDNSWDYATRNTSYACTFLFSIIGFFSPIPGGALVGAALGASIGGVLGWFFGLYVIRQARIMQPEEQRALTVPWTQAMANGGTLFSLFGASAGVGIGMLIGGPAVAMLGATLGLSVGGLVGSMCGVLFNRTAINTLLGRPPLQAKPVEQAEKVAEEEAPLLLPLTPAPSPVFQHIQHLFPPTPTSAKPDVVLQEEKEMPVLILEEPHRPFIPSVIEIPSNTEEAGLSPDSLNRYKLFKNHFAGHDVPVPETNTSPSFLVACI